MEAELTAYCALNKIFGYEPRPALALVRHLGSAHAVFEAKRDELRTVLGSNAKFLNKICVKALDEAEIELAALVKLGGSFVPYPDEGYPCLLKECDDPPLGLYVKTSDKMENIFGDGTAIAVVGTRDMSQYGRDWCQKFIESLSDIRPKPVIVSGLAYGIDICAHTAALKAGLPTVAVMATGIDMVYPSRHSMTAERIAETPACALITDYPLGTPPLHFNFLRRNRIIAGLSSCTILVESKTRGGGMTSARLAVSYNRDVYALPGRTEDIRSQGCNELIRQKLAEPLTEAENAASQIGLRKSRSDNKSDRFQRLSLMYAGMEPELLSALLSVAAAIKNQRGIRLEEIMVQTGLSYAAVSCASGILSADGIIETDILGQCSLN